MRETCLGPQVFGHLPVHNWIRIGESIISATSELKIDLRNPLLHPIDKTAYLAHAILTRFATFDAVEWKYTVVNNPPDVSGRARGRTREYLSDKVDSERVDGDCSIGLFSNEHLGSEYVKEGRTYQVLRNMISGERT